MDVRASDAERDATVNRLRAAATEGRLTLEELTDRIEAAANAVTRSDLAPLTSDLPATAAVGVATQPAGVSGVGDVKRSGAWTVPADSLNESQLAARSGPFPPRRTSPTAESKQQASKR